MGCLLGYQYLTVGIFFSSCESCSYLRRLVSYPISDSVWLTDGSLLVGFGHFMLLYGERFKTKSCPDQLREETLFDYVDGQNKPVREYHPQMILQLLIWGRSYSPWNPSRYADELSRKGGIGQGDNCQISTLSGYR